MPKQVQTEEKQPTELKDSTNPIVAEYIRRNEAYEAFIKLLNQVFVNGADYMEQPWGGQRRVLLKGGAERALYIAGGRVDNVHIEHRWEDGHYTALVEIRLVDAEGRFLSLGVGVCSTRERRYERQPNEHVNTVVKMAKKRAFVDAVISGLSLSSLFTQDIEEDEHPATRDTRATRATRNTREPRPMNASEQRILRIYNANRAKHGQEPVQHYDEVPMAAVEAIQRRLQENNRQEVAQPNDQ